MPRPGGMSAMLWGWNGCGTAWDHTESTEPQYSRSIHGVDCTEPTDEVNTTW